MIDEDAAATEGYLGPLDLPDDFDPSPDDTDDAGAQSLTDDLVALIDDGKTYVEAEVAFQKSRAVYVTGRTKGALFFGFGAFGVFHLALIAATIGAIIALAPLVGPWLATVIVTVALVIAGLVLLRLLKGRLDDIIAAFSDDAR